MVLGVWHQDLAAATALFRGDSVVTFISESKDGDFLALLLKWMGFKAIRGSTSKGSSKIRHILECQERVWAMALDGPRGPKGKVQPGTYWLVQKSKRTLWIPTFHYGLKFQLSTWDQMILPLPFSKIRVEWSHYPRQPDTAISDSALQFENPHLCPERSTIKKDSL